MRIDITNGFVEILDFVPRKATKAFNNVMCGDAFIDVDSLTGEMVNGKNKIPVDFVDRAQEALVINMATKAVIDGEAVPNLTKFLSEGIDSLDYDKLALACMKIFRPSAAEKEAATEKKTRSSTDISGGSEEPQTTSPGK